MARTELTEHCIELLESNGEMGSDFAVKLVS
jgi:hypothetical protein